jgi:drug/metabolite transporter (DMT)-like permease
MPIEALLLVLGSAGLHAVWNTLLAGARDSRAATNLALVAGTLVLLPVAIATWRVEAAVLPYAVGSAALEVVYVLLLGAAYNHSELSLVYPVARGVSPVVVLCLAFGVGGTPGPIGALGAVLVGAGVVAMRGLGRRGIAFGLAIGCLLGAITTIDHFGVRHAGTFPYLLVVIAPAAIASVALDCAQGRAGALRDALTARTLFAGLGFATTYGLILAALRIAPAASVAAVRELSIVVAVALGAFVLHEPVTRRRLAAACVVTVGAVLAAAGA